MKENQTTKLPTKPKRVLFKPVPPDKERSKAERFAISMLSLLFVAVSIGVYIQLLPLVYVFLGAMMGLSPDVKIGQMDLVVWAMTCIGVTLPLSYLLIRICRYLWRHMVMMRKGA